MLLYIFWHWPQSHVAIADYESDECAFQAALHKEAPAGLRASGFFGSKASPWANEGGSAYEDLYLLDGSAALDILNAAAVHGRCKEPHDRLARAMFAGTAGLYTLALGTPAEVPAGDAAWFRKPQSMTLSGFYAAMAPAVQPDRASLWRRQMVLSPAPEFCAFGFDPSALLPGLEPIRPSRTPLWSRVLGEQ